jgi:hypothetical protein
MKTLTKGLLVLLALSFTGCEEVINVDLETAEPKLVIDASIDWIKNTPGNEQKIILSTTTGYYSPTFPTVSGATVIVTNTLNTVFNFNEIPNTGEYICSNFQPVIGETYTMTITLNGETYTAIETLIEAPDIEAAIEQNSTGGITGDEFEITYHYQDNGTQENFYMNRVISPRVIFPVFEIEDDNYSNGSMMAESYSHEDLRAGDLLNIRLYGISKRYYMYFSKLLLASGGDGSPFPTIPTAVRGNIVNQTNSQNFAFGYFRLAEVSVRDYTIQ